MPDQPQSLMDRLHAATFANKFAGVRTDDDTRRVLAAYRTKLRQAEKFILDEDAVGFVCDLAHGNDDADFSALAVLARLPHDPLWIEFDRPPKPRVGYLMYHDRSDGACWIAHEFSEAPADKIAATAGIDNAASALAPALIALLFDPEGERNGTEAKYFQPLPGSYTWRAKTVSSLAGFPPIKLRNRYSKAPDFAEWYAEQTLLCRVDAPFTGGAGEVIGVSDTTWGENRIAVILDPYWEQRADPRALEPVYQSVVMDVGNRFGILRFLVALLASINALPRKITTAPARSGARRVGMHNLPYFRHNTLSIDLPRDNRVAWARGRLSQEARKRAWHRVRGHWRIIEYGRSAGFCRHQPTMVEAGLALCERCALLIRWIPSHARGDPTVGIIEHTYQVAGSISPVIERVP